MRAFQVFGSMSPEQAEGFFRALHEQAPGVFAQAVGAASAAMNSRPQYLMKQPMDKRIRAVRRALSRVHADAVAEEMLAVYFLECRQPVLADWLDRVGLEHEDGILQEDAPSEPPRDVLEKCVADYRAASSDEDRADRELLLRAFAAQSSIEWPGLEELLEG